ncbi:hypothetical protein N8T08_003842 [Aspergillus melleus]|uniref:Uncharacterized protein n=1 Tax=Aspergillus melleus TaxID=138277 RepID=A0ACC3B6G9_9EURO|nr:hypothetical protein N8T08_003842 [Aspergillus melleus]
MLNSFEKDGGRGQQINGYSGGSWDTLSLMWTRHHRQYRPHQDPISGVHQRPHPGHEQLQCPAYSFLVEHPSGKKDLFDLDVRKDFDRSAPALLNAWKGRITLDVEDDIAGIVKKDGRVGLEEINSISWSGDPSTFPSTTELVVGPGFKDALLPGYPTNPESRILEANYQGRELREVSFDEGLRLGRFRVLDYFGDGSFYLLDSPGA